MHVDSFGRLQSAAYGAVPREVAPGQSSRDGEDWAIFMLCDVAMPPFQLYVDCQGTVDCLRKGPGAGEGPGELRAHMWDREWGAFMPADCVVHETDANSADVEAGRSTWWEESGTAIADTHAKLGARSHGASEDVELVSGA